MKRKVFIAGCALAAVAAGCLAVAFLFASPAAASPGGVGSSDPPFPWDTDNLRYSVGVSNYSARTFGIPFHEYSGYAVRTETYRQPAGCIGFYDENGDPVQACWSESDVNRNNEPCQSGVADGFFQTVAGGRNDFPVLQITDPDATETAEALKSWGTSRNRGCDEFTAAQDRLVSTAAANGGYYLDNYGNLATGSLPAHVLSTRSVAMTRVEWASRVGFSSYYQAALYGSGGTTYLTVPASYAPRVDIGGTGGALAVSPAGTQLTVPSAPNWPARKTASGIIQWHQLPSFNSAGHLPLPMAIGGTQSGVWCPTGFHPRGEDGLLRVGRGSGRTLTSLASDAKIQQADKFWCRSDVRYQIGYKKQTHTQTCGPSPRTACPSGVTLPNDRFSAYGRVNCYYTVISLDTANNNTCRYYHPIPQCTDSDSNAKREYTTQELATYSTGEKFPAKTDGTTSCGEATAAPPPQLAGFTADACVTASLVIGENRIVGSDAEPGVPASDRTLVVASGRTAWDLDVTSPHPSTASPPRDTTAGSGDPDGCADGSESRADHASSPGGAARKQSPAPSYAASDRTDTAAPPNDADGDIDYSGAAKNIAHRYASQVAENTCAAKLAEAEAELSLLEVREDAFAQWLTDYKAAADTNASRYSSYTRTPQQSGSGLAILRFNDYEANKATYAALLATRYTALSSALSAAKTAYDTTTDRSAGPSRAAVIAASSDSGCIVHYTAEITRLKTLFSNAETAAASRIRAAQTAVTQTRLVSPAAVANNDSAVGYRVPDISAVLARTETTRTCADDWNPPFCSRPAEEGEDCGIFGCAGTWTTTTTSYYTCPGGTYSVAGTVSRSYKGTRSVSYSTTYTAAGRSTESTSRTCPGWTSARTSGYSYAAYSDAVAYVMGTPGTASSLPSVATASAPETLRALGKASLLGNYYLSHTDRANLKATSADDRNTAGSSLSVTTGSVPSGSPQKVEDYQTAYKTAYDTAFSQAEGHMSGTSWDSFDWRYQTSTLAWGSYQEDPATTYSASTATPRDGTGCDLITVATDGSVSVEATRLDYETSSYGKGSVYSTRTDTQRTCKIRRTRTPELILEYQPSRPSGTDTSKAATFWHVDYQPTPAAERFKLYDEAEVFAVKTSLADRAPVLCYQPGEALVAHVAAKGIDAVNKAVFRHASGFAGGNKKHCYRHPSAAQLGTPPKPAFVFFDDTAHSAMASVNVVWQQLTPKIVSKLGSEDDLKMMANTVSLVASSPVAYDDATRTSSFYGTYYTFPTTDTSVKSPSGWDITGHPTLTLASTFTQHQVQAKDTAAKTPTTHTMVFKFIDCVFGIEDVAFVDNIASPYALLSDENGMVPARWKQTYDSDPHSSPTWYYPAFSTYEGALRLDGRRDSNGNPITYGRNTQGGFAHPSYDLENTAADGIGWGIVYEDKVGKQQPVWAVYAPTVPGDNTRLAIQVCGANNLGTNGANPAAATGTPSARRIGTPASAPPASGVWSWKSPGWNYQDNPIMLWSADDDPDRDDPWETRTSESSLALPRKPHNNMEFATEDSNVAALDVFQDASNPAPAGYSRLEDQDMVLANFQPLAVSKSARAQLGGYSPLARSQSSIVPARPSSSTLTP